MSYLIDMMKNKSRSILALSSILLVISTVIIFIMTTPKLVKTTASEDFEKKMLNEPFVVSLEQTFRRPALRIKMDVNSSFDESSLQMTLMHLKQFVTPSHMTEVSQKYWNDQLFYVEVHIFKENSESANGDYLLTAYYFSDSGKQIINDYKTWQVEVWDSKAKIYKLNNPTL